MRLWTASLFCLLLSLVLGVGPAQAQSEAPAWTDPAGRFSVRFEPGWRVGPGTTAGEMVLAAPAPEEMPADCSISQHDQPMPRQLTREELNHATRVMLQDSVVGGLREMPGADVLSTQIVEAGGVAVLDVTLTTAGRMTLRSIQRRFLMQANNRLQVFTLMCQADDGDREAKAAISRVVATLEFSNP